jgi:hypothetical protein
MVQLPGGRLGDAVVGVDPVVSRAGVFAVGPLVADDRSMVRNAAPAPIATTVAATPATNTDRRAKIAILATVVPPGQHDSSSNANRCR